MAEGSVSFQLAGVFTCNEDRCVTLWSNGYTFVKCDYIGWNATSVRLMA